MKKDIDNKSKIVTWAIVGVMVALTLFVVFKPKTETQVALDDFAACIAESGANFYGAFWCSHCDAQKKSFANSKNLPYIECSTPDGKGQLAVCSEAGIKAYPTWRFADGGEETGELTFDELAQFTNCQAPQ